MCSSDLCTRRDHGGLGDAALRWQASPRVDQVVATAPAMDSGSRGRHTARRLSNRDDSDRTIVRSRNLDADLCRCAAAVSHRQVAIAVDETAAPVGKSSVGHRSVERSFEQGGGTIGDPTLADTVQVESQAGRTLNRAPEQVPMVAMKIGRAHV